MTRSSQLTRPSSTSRPSAAEVNAFEVDPDREERVLVDGRAGRDVANAVAAGVDDLAVRDHGQRQAGDVPGLHGGGDVVVQACQRGGLGGGRAREREERDGGERRGREREPALEEGPPAPTHG